MLQDRRILRFLTNNDASCNPEPEILGFVADDGWPMELCATPRTRFVALAFTTWSIKPGLDMFGIGIEDSRLLIFLCGGQ